MISRASPAWWTVLALGPRAETLRSPVLALGPWAETLRSPVLALGPRAETLPPGAAEVRA